MVEYVVRREDWRDYARIAELHAEAFDYNAGSGEVGLVDALRRRRLHVPQLSLAAKSEGRVIGHAMFSLHEVRIDGKPFRASILAPVAVAKEFRRRGVAASLIEEGHRILEDMGVKVGFVLGNPAYYSRFGYRPGMFGTCRLRVAAEAAEAAPSGPSLLTERRVMRDDIAGLRRMWELWYGDADLSLAPGDDLTDWISPDKRFRSVVVEREGAKIGYVKYREDRPYSPDMVLAENGEAMMTVLAHLASLSREPLSLPLHPSSRAVRDWLRVPYEPETNVWGAGMMRSFGSGSPEAEAYMEEVRAGKRLPGLMVWPAAFDFCS
jgi:predicted N-acetyltransferase YhbS